MKLFGVSCVIQKLMLRQISLRTNLPNNLSPKPEKSIKISYNN